MTPVNLGNLPSNVPAPTGTVVRYLGNQEAYSACVNGGWLTGMGVSITPQYNCAFVLKASLLVINIGAAVWSRADFALRCSINDKAGFIQRGKVVHTSHNALTWTTIVLKAVWQLQAGVAYSFGVYQPYVQQANVMYYHQAGRHFHMVGYTLGEGAMA